jgi:hypothetical protein
MGVVAFYNIYMETDIRQGESMEIIVKVGGRWKKDGVVHNWFYKCKGRINTTMEHLASRYEFQRPSELLLRPLYCRTDGPYLYNGRAQYRPWEGYSILLVPPALMDMHDRGMHIVDHEACHIAAAIKWDDWSHGKRFRDMLSSCRKTL